jgi:predicted dehydrogenase
MTAPEAMNVAVVGLGPMGMHHVRAMADVPGVKLTAVADVDRAKAEDTAKAFNCRALYDASDVPGLAEAAVIATPPECHAQTAVPLLRAGIHCLIEKPLAMSEGDCAAIMDAAAAGMAVVGVGHIERFNPALEALMAQRIPAEAIRSITVRRFSPVGGRYVALDVVLDMMIHDLDIVLALKPKDLVSTVGYGSFAEHAKATLLFKDRSHAELSVARQSQTPMRELTLRTENHDYTLDFSAKTVARRAHGDGPMEMLPVTNHDALRAELADFIHAARSGASPRVTPVQAMPSLRAAWAIQDEMRGCQA